jgi:hypothetical protein
VLRGILGASNMQNYSGSTTQKNNANDLMTSEAFSQFGLYETEIKQKQTSTLTGQYYLLFCCLKFMLLLIVNFSKFYNFIILF